MRRCAHSVIKQMLNPHTHAVKNLISFFYFYKTFSKKKKIVETMKMLLLYTLLFPPMKI